MSMIDRNLLPNICFDDGRKFAYNGKESPLQQALCATSQSLYLVATGGIGKTTSLRSFWLDFLRGYHNVPCLYIDLKLLSGRDCTPILSYIQGMEKYDLELPSPLAGLGAPVLLLDGANESPVSLREGDPCRLVAECQSLIENGWRIVIVSRSDKIRTVQLDETATENGGSQRELPEFQYGSFAELTEKQVKDALNADVDQLFYRLLSNNMMLSIYKDLKSYGIDLQPNKLSAGLLLKYYVEICLKVRYVKSRIGGDKSEREIFNILNGPSPDRDYSRWLDDYTDIIEALMDDPVHLSKVPFNDPGLNASLANISLVMEKRKEESSDDEFDFLMDQWEVASSDDQYIWANELYQSYFEAELLVRQLQVNKLKTAFWKRDSYHRDFRHYYDVFKFAGDLLIAEFEKQDPANTYHEMKKWLDMLFATAENEKDRNTITVLSVLSGNGFPKGISTIGKRAFFKCNYLESVIIPKTVREIEDLAFAGCKNLREVKFEEGSELKKIGYEAFAVCINLEGMIFPDGVTEWGFAVLHGCHGLIYLEIPNMQGAVMSFRYSDGLREFSKLKLNEYQGGLYLGNKNNPFVAYARPKDKGIVSAYIHDDAECICDDAFHGCKELSDVRIPKDVGYIGERAFMGCNSLRELILPISLFGVGEEAFWGCNGLQKIQMGEGNPKFYCRDNCLIKREGNVLVLGCNNSIIPKDVTDIDDYFVKGYCEDPSYKFGNDLEKIEVEEGNPKYYSQGNCLIERISKRVLLLCKNSSIIPNDILDFDEGALVRGGKFSYTLYENGEYFGSEENPYLVFSKIHDASCSYCKINVHTRFIFSAAFMHCENLKHLSIPNDGLKFLEGRIAVSLADCKGLKYNEYHNGLYLGSEDNPYFLFCRMKDREVACFEINARTKIIMPHAFSGCSMLEKVIIPEGTTHILPVAFSMCPRLSSLVLPSSIIKIGGRAFMDCGFSEITIPESVRAIGSNAFTYCSNLKKATILSKEIILREDVFSGCGALTDIYCVADSKPVIWDKNCFALLHEYGETKIHWGYKG